MFDFLCKRPFILSSIGCVIASVLGFYSKAALFCYIAFIIIWFLHFAFKTKNFNIAAMCFIVLLCALSVLVTVTRVQGILKFDKSAEECTFIVKKITYTGDEFYIAKCEIIDRNDNLNHANVSVFLKPPQVKSGDILNANLTFSKIDGKYIKNSYSEGIYLTASSKDVTVTVQKDFILSSVENIRTYIKNTLFSNMDYSEAATLCALLFGDRNYFTDEFYSCVLGSGTSHVMVVSGMHLSIMVTLFTYLLNKVVYNRYVKAVFILITVLIMTAVCGFTMSILRAGITYLIMAFAISLNREHTPENTLGAAISIILIFSPFAVFSVALQLSTLSTFGILCINIPLIDYIKITTPIKSDIILSLIAAVTVSLSAMLLTLPVTIYVFGYVSKVAVITNLLISSAVTLAVSIAVSALIINLILPTASFPLFFLCEAITAYVNRVIMLFGSNENAIAYTDRKYWTVSVGLILFVFWLLLTCKKRINMLRLKGKREKILKEGGKKIKWQ